jgi:hypothetical protein
MDQSPAVFRATFSDFRPVKGRKVLQIILEVPIEEGDGALRVLGGLPQPHQERWVAVARLETTDKPAQDIARLAQLAAMKCQDPAFKKFIRDNFGADETAAFVRLHCDVDSRAYIREGTIAGDKFKTLLRQFDAWMVTP